MAGPTTLDARDGTGFHRNMSMAQDANGNYAPGHYLVDRFGVPIAPAGNFVTLVGSMTRQANTTDYAYGQIVSDNVVAISVNDFCITPGGSARIKHVKLCVQATGLNAPGSEVKFRGVLFGDTPSVVTDGAAFNWLWADRAKRLGWVDFEVPMVMGGSADCTEYMGVLSGGEEMAAQINNPARTTLLVLLVTMSAWASPPPGAGLQIILTAGDQT
jgi:hypothetical protein